MQCGSMSSQCQLILLGCRRMLQMPSALLPCTKIQTIWLLSWGASGLQWTLPGSATHWRAILGETRSVNEFNIFSQMPAERLCLGCGVQSDERFQANTARLPNGCRKWILLFMMRVSSTGTWMKRLPLPVYHAAALSCGWDHRQTPGGLRKSTAARRFRRKLLKRPLALRGNSNKVQPNTLYQIVGRYLTGTPPLSCISCGPINGSWPTPSAKCPRTLEEPREGATWSLWLLAVWYCSPHSACNPLVGHT